MTDEFGITMWQYVEMAPSTELDVVANVRTVPRLHRALRDYPRPLHGDAPAVNLLETRQGRLYADFEEPVWGPVEFDLALMGPEAVAAYDETATELGLRRVDAEALRVIEAVAYVQVVACFAMVPQLPVLAEYLELSLPEWRESPFALGVPS